MQKYQESLEELVKGNDFVFDSIDLLLFHVQKINLNRGGLYVISPKWLKNKKVTLNSKKDDSKSFKYALTLALNYQSIKKALKEYQKLIFLLNNMIRKK